MHLTSASVYTNSTSDVLTRVEIVRWRTTVFGRNRQYLFKASDRRQDGPGLKLIGKRSSVATFYIQYLLAYSASIRQAAAVVKGPTLSLQWSCERVGRDAALHSP
jgi:hypothetical protein